MVNRQCLTYTLGTSPLSLLFQPCRGLTNKVAAHFFISNIVAACLSQPITCVHNCFMTLAFAIIAVMSWHDINCESVAGYIHHSVFVSSWGGGRALEQS